MFIKIEPKYTTFVHHLFIQIRHDRDTTEHRKLLIRWKLETVLCVKLNKESWNRDLLSLL